MADWINIDSFVIRPQWITGAEAPPVELCKELQDWAVVDNSKLARRTRSFPTDITNPESSSLMKAWLDKELISRIVPFSALTKDRVALYLGL